MMTDLTRFLGSVHVAAVEDGEVIGEKLQRDDFQNRQEQLRGRRDEYGAIGEPEDFAIAFGGDGDGFSAAAFDVFED